MVRGCIPTEIYHCTLLVDKSNACIKTMQLMFAYKGDNKKERALKYFILISSAGKMCRPIEQNMEKTPQNISIKSE